MAGESCLDAKSIKWSCNLMVEYFNRKHTMLKFDLVEGESPLIIIFDVKLYADTHNMEETQRILFRIPTDTIERTFFTYIYKDPEGNYIIRFEIAPHNGTTVDSLMGGIQDRR